MGEEWLLCGGKKARGGIVSMPRLCVLVDWFIILLVPPLLVLVTMRRP